MSGTNTRLHPDVPRTIKAFGFQIGIHTGYDISELGSELYRLFCLEDARSLTLKIRYALRKSHPIPVLCAVMIENGRWLPDRE